jgi:uncharacterized protein
MFFSVKELELKKIRFDQSFGPGEITFPDPALKQVKAVHAEGEVELLPHTDGEIRIKGRVATEIAAECDRCLGSVQIPIDAPIDLFYRPAAELNASDVEEEIELDEGEAEIAFYAGGGIELEQVISEQILLLLPMQLVCQESCKGMCPICGGNRRETGCNCKNATTDDRWSALRDVAS